MISQRLLGNLGVEGDHHPKMCAGLCRLTKSRLAHAPPVKSPAPYVNPAEYVIFSPKARPEVVRWKVTVLQDPRKSQA